jgi:mono/diheme cytochrome c family protein
MRRNDVDLIGKRKAMKRSWIALVVLSLLGSFCAGASAQEAAALYKSKCAVCHGDQGQGKPKLGAKLAGTAKSEQEIATLLSNGGGKKAPHLRPMNGFSAEQGKAVAAFVKSLK